ncbi:MAG: hypothetical protein RL030_364 [Pseudomonadota bacterium]|jgi:hypothetical protein
MSEFVGWFVQHPLRIVALAAIYFAAWGVLRASSSGRRINSLLLPAVFCLAFAAWEWLVLERTPEADIRVDLLLIWPILLVLTAWSLWRVLRRPTAGPGSQ